jgi:hypothetical protein
MQIIQNGFHGGTPGVRLEKLQSGMDVLFHPAPFGAIADFRMQHLTPSLKTRREHVQQRRLCLPAFP